jgi:acetyltransferase-like isoleucine patch superfamily enzyme
VRDPRYPGVLGPVRLLIEEPYSRVALRGRLLAPYRRLRFQRFGAHSVVDRPEWLYGVDHIAIGERVVVMRGAWLSVERLAWDKPAPALSIGDGSALRPHVHISAAESVVIEEDVGIGAFSTIVDNDHVRGDRGIVYNQEWVSTPIRIGRGTWVGDRVAILRGTNIGRHCVIGTNSVVRGEIPDYSVAVGAPARVVGSTRGTTPETSA